MFPRHVGDDQNTCKYKFIKWNIYKSNLAERCSLGRWQNKYKGDQHEGDRKWRQFPSRWCNLMIVVLLREQASIIVDPQLSWWSYISAQRIIFFLIIPLRKSPLLWLLGLSLVRKSKYTISFGRPCRGNIFAKGHSHRRYTFCMRKSKDHIHI